MAMLAAACVLSAQPSLPAVPPIPDNLDLPTALSYALENNFSIRQARERLRREDGVVTTVTASGLPAVTAAGTYQRAGIPVLQTSPTPAFLPEGPFWRITVTATQSIYAGGGVRAAIRGAEFSREAAAFDLQMVMNQELLRVRIRYFDVLLAREQARVEQQNLDLLERQRADTTQQVEVGRLSQFERLRADVAVANARAPLIRAENAFRLAVEELRRALGYRGAPSEKIPDFDGELKVVPVQIDLQASLDTARKSRPDIRRLERLVAAEDSAIIVERAKRYPNVTASVASEARRGATGSIGDAREGVRGGLSLRENANLATGARISQAESRAEQARLNLAESRLAAEVEVRRAVVAVEQALELANALEKTISQAEEAVSHARVRYQSGGATQLDVLSSQVELTRARTNTLRANHGYAVAVAQLRAAMGFGDVGIEGAQKVSDGTAEPANK